MADNIKLPKFPDWMPLPTHIIVGDTAYARLLEIAEGRDLDRLLGLKVIKASDLYSDEDDYLDDWYG